MKVRLINGVKCVSIGDALRFVDQLHVIKSDCVILTGDVVTNMNLKLAVDSHIVRRNTDSSSIMTIVTSQGNRNQSSAAVLDKNTRRLLQWKQISRKRDSSRLVIDASFFSERDTIEVRNDLFSSEIYICAPEVLALFSENFDYQTLHEDFITGVLSEEELGNKIFIYECKGEYAQRVENLRLYDSISRDVLARWTYPFILDTRIFSSVTAKSYTFHRGNHYLSMDLRLPLNVELGGNGVCIGAGSVIGEHCVIEESVIGQNCIIEAGAIIKGSYLFNEVRIGSKAKIINSLICDSCVVHTLASVNEGCVVSYGVVISPHQSVPAYTNLTLCSPSHFLPESSEGGESESSTPKMPIAGFPEEKTLEIAMLMRDLSISHKIQRPSYFNDEAVGPRGAGCKWPHVHKHNFKFYSIAKPPPVSELVESEDEDSEAESAASVDLEEVDPDQLFEREVAETFLRCVYHKFSKENVVLELNGLKLAELKNFVDCANYIYTTLLQMCMPPSEFIKPIYRSLFPSVGINLTAKSDQKQFLTSLTNLLTEWGPILQKFLKDEDDQVELMFTFEEFYKGEGVFSSSSSWSKSLSPLISLICHLLYEKDIVSEEAFLTWAAEKEQATEDEDKIFYSKAKAFIDWLNEAEESDESD
eukprot:g2085.t1